MKKNILGVFLTLLIIFSLTIIKPDEAKAETPDLFLMNEIFLYDYDSFNFEPNFTNDYLLMTTILPSDIESEISSYLGWYKNLGYNNLLVQYYGDDVDNDKRGYMCIPLNGVLGANFQLGYIAQSPFAISFGVVFTDGTMQTWDTETNGYGAQILTLQQTNLIKNIYCFWWEYKTADYVPSFKFLGVTDGYDIGYQNGENVGYDRGYQLGYNKGFDNGFIDGVSQSEDIVIYEKVLNFNQLIKNGNFTNFDYWEITNATYTIENNICNLTTTTTPGRIIQRNINLLENHKYLVMFTIKSIERNNDYYAQFALNTNYSIKSGVATTEFDKKTTIFTALNSGDYSLVIGNYTEQQYLSTLQIKNVMVIDLTKMYGSGFEPDLEQCNLIFNSDYYDYTIENPLSIGYFTGYYDGIDDGTQKGINIGESKQINMNWIKSIFTAIGGVLSIQIFPSVTIGMIVGIPFIISLAWFVIRMFRGGGGE